MMYCVTSSILEILMWFDLPDFKLWRQWPSTSTRVGRREVLDLAHLFLLLLFLLFTHTTKSVGFVLLFLKLFLLRGSPSSLEHPRKENTSFSHLDWFAIHSTVVRRIDHSSLILCPCSFFHWFISENTQRTNKPKQEKHTNKPWFDSQLPLQLCLLFYRVQQWVLLKHLLLIVLLELQPLFINIISITTTTSHHLCPITRHHHQQLLLFPWTCLIAFPESPNPIWIIFCKIWKIPKKLWIKL